jgi:hypothetical protein
VTPEIVFRTACRVVLIGLTVAAVGLSGCSKKKETSSSGTAQENYSSPQTSTQNASVQAERTVDKALARNIDLLRSLKGVLKAEVGDLNGKPCIKVYVTEKTAEIERDIPDFIEGYPVVVEENDGQEVSNSK